MENQYRFSEDVKLIREMLKMTQQELANALDVNKSTINRWENDEVKGSDAALELFYNYAFSRGIDLNRIKEQFYREEAVNSDSRILFHGAKNSIEGEVRADVARANNDFGTGFYLGESLIQSSLFVSNFEKSCVYIAEFHTGELTGITYEVNRDWMLTIAYFRGRIQKFHDSNVIRDLLKKLDGVDYVVAPIADNRMYQIIEDYIDGAITDAQCQHALAATDLGNQYVLKTQKAVSRLNILERRFLCKKERQEYQNIREHDRRISDDKVKAAKIRYRGTGHYIDEIL